MAMKNTLDGRAFAASRILLGLTMEDVCAGVGITMTTLRKVEHGVGDPRISTITKLLDFYASRDVRISRPHGRVQISVAASY